MTRTSRHQTLRSDLGVAPSGESRGVVATRIVAATAAAFLLGGLTSLGQGYLPHWSAPLANSIGGWTAFTFLLAWASRVRPVPAAIVGILSFEALNEGYGVASALRGLYYSAPLSNIWSILGLLAGPFVGFAAGATRWGAARGRITGVGLLAAIFTGEGIISFLQVRDTTGWQFWTIEFVAGIGLAALTLVRNPRPRRETTAWALAIVAAAALFLLAFRVILG